MQIRLRSLSPPPFRFSAPPLPVVALLLALAGQLALVGKSSPWIGVTLLACGSVGIAVAAVRAGSATAATTPTTSGSPAPATAPSAAPTASPAKGTSASSTDGAPTTSPLSNAPAVRADPDGLLGGRTGLATLLLVTALAAAFRLPGLDRLPPGLAADEAALGLDAVRMLSDGWGGLAWAGWPIFHLLTLGSVAALGQTVMAVRLPDAVAGVLFAPAIFLLGRQVGGTRLGAVAGLLGAVVFWHADLTRGAWGYGAWGLICETFALALLVRTMKQPSTGLTALAGLLFGLALQASWGALAAIGAGLLLAAWSPGQPGTRRQRLAAVAGPFLVYFAIAAGPVLIGVSIPDRTPDRTWTAARSGMEAPWVAATAQAATIAPSGTAPGSAAMVPSGTSGSPSNPATAYVAAAGGQPQASAAAPLLAAGSPADRLRQAGRLLLLFNVAGDPSPLHALRAEPMLDPATGALLVLGIVVALVHWRQAPAAVLVAWLLGALAVALVVGRSPQPDSVIAIHALPPALLLAGGALIAAAGGLSRRRPGAMGWHLDLTLGMLALIVGINAHSMYVRRPADTTTWMAYASAEALAAREIGKLAPSTAIYLADVWIDHPTIRYLARMMGEPRRFDTATTLPMVQDETFAYFTPGYLDVIPDDLERVYEDGEIDRFRSPMDESTIVVRSFRVRARVVAEARGVTVRATPTDGSKLVRYTLQDFQLAWPIPGEPERTAGLEIYGAVSVQQPGQYRLRLTAPPGAALEVNGAPVTLTGQEAEVTLAGGSQRFRITATVNGPARFDLQWLPPGAREFVPIPQDRVFREQRDAIGLLALYRSGTDPAAPPELARVERYLQRAAAPPPLARPYVVDWMGVLDAPKSGAYRFKLDASGPASLWIDDRPVMLGVQGIGSTASVVVPEGDHRIQVRLIDRVGPTRLDLAWAPPGDDMVAIPTSRFEPPDAAVNTVVPLAMHPDTAFTPLGTPRIRWLASTDGEPRAVAVQPDGDVFLANAGARQVQQVLENGQALLPLPAPLSVPSDVEIGPDGKVWAIDALLADVVRLADDGTVDRSLATRDLGLYRPRGLAIAPDGSILIADTGGSRIVRLNADGSLRDVIGPVVGGMERLRQPTDVAVGPEGQIFVVNGEAGALLRLSPGGQYERHWSVLPADTERGAHLAIGPDRSLWVSEPEGRRISRFTFDGAPAGVVDQTTVGRVLRVPVGIAIGPDGTLYVADASLRAIVALSFDR